MRIAFFSPLPPARSGIADYSAALLEPLKRIAEVEVFESPPAEERLKEFDVLLYQMGNNAYHSSIYEYALKHPGVLEIGRAHV